MPSDLEIESAATRELELRRFGLVGIADGVVSNVVVRQTVRSRDGRVDLERKSFVWAGCDPFVPGVFVP